MGIKILTSPTLTVNAAGDGFDAPDDTTLWPAGSSGTVLTPPITGIVKKVVLNFTSSDANAVLTVATRDTPSENVVNVTGWTSDITLYPKLEAKDNTNSSLAAANKTNVFTEYTVASSLSVGCSAATDNDTVVIKIYYWE